MRLLRRPALFWFFSISAFMAGSVYSVLSGGDYGAAQGEERPQKAEASHGSDRKPGSVDATESSSFSPSDGTAAPQEKAETNLPDPAAINDLKARKERLDVREKDLNAREAELKAKEQALNEELKKIEQVREDITKIDTSRKKENDERVAKIVETLETMSPKASSQMLSNLDEALAVAAIAKISTQRLAKIMNVMDPEKSSRLTEILAGVVRARNATPSKGRASASLDAAETAKSQSTKGGESKNGQTN